MGQTGSVHKGVGRALAEERVRAEIAVKLHMAIGNRESHRAALEAAFQASDADGDGTVDFVEFCSTAAALNMGVSEEELRSAFKRFDKNGDESVEFSEVLDFMCPTIKSGGDAQKAAHVEYLARMVENRENLEVEDESEDGVTAAVRRVASVVYDKEINIRAAFKTWDRDGSGKLDVSEFVSAMNSLGFSMDLADARHVFKAFDVDGDGRLACWEFVRTLGQFEAELNGGEGPMVGHNTGRGGGGDDRKLKPPSSAAEAAEKAAAEAKRREQEALKLLAKQQEALAKQQAAMAAQGTQRQAALAAQQQAAREEELRRRQMAAEMQRQAEAQGMAQAQAQLEQAAQAQAAKLQAERERAMQYGRQAKAEAEALAAQMEQERLEKEAMAAELAAMKDKERALEEAMSGAKSDLAASGLAQFGAPTSQTDVFEKGVYAWSASHLDDGLSDAEIVDALKKRLKSVHAPTERAPPPNARARRIPRTLTRSAQDRVCTAERRPCASARGRYVHTSPAQALAECVREPRLASDPGAYSSHGVDAPVLQAFCAQLLYNLSDGRAARLLANISGALPIVPVPMFLSLFGGLGSSGTQGAKHNPVLGRKVEALAEREKKLLGRLREFLFEQHSQMKRMYERCDPDGNGYVSIEEFMKAMQRAGVAVNGSGFRGLDRVQDNSITEDEAANILAYFDKDGDGYLQYHEFMSMLQSTKNSVLTKVMAKTEC